MINKIDIQIEEYNLKYIEGVRQYSTICNTKLMNESWTIDQIINWCIEWIYESFANILGQIIVIPIPMGNLSCDMLKKILEQVQAIKIEEESFSDKKAECEAEFLKKMLQQNNIRLTKAIEQTEKGITGSMEQELDYTDDGKVIELSVKVRPEIQWKWVWLKDMLERQHGQTMTWGELIAYCLIGTYTMLKGLKGGFQLRIPLKVIGVEGAEQLEEQFEKWITEDREKGAAEEEIAVLEQGKEAIHQEIWQAVKMKLNEDRRKNKYIVIVKKEGE